MNGKKMLYMGIAVLILGIGFAVGTYAYYQSTKEGSATGTVLYWDCNSGTTTAKQTFANMYPGTNGTITFTLKCSIAADYTITFSDYSNLATGGHPNLKLYKDSAYATVLSSGGSITGTLTAGSAKTETIYYNWPYGTTTETYSSAIPSFKYTITYNQKQ